MKRIFVFALCILFALSMLFVSCKKSDVEVVSNQGSAATNNATATASTTTIPVPTGLPTHIAFGTEGAPDNADQFIKESEYQYQYLAGDIFSNGWTTWNAPTGEFARRFLTTTDKMGKVPVFTYYNIVPAKNRFEDPGFTNLNDAEVMNKYFDDFKLLLQICKTFNKPVIIHYEPDLFGYMEVYKNDPVKSTIKVGASNQADVKNFTNDAKGLAQAIVSMRDKYAPNVLLAWHASSWATNYDLIADKRDPEQTASEIASFYKSLNANFDLVFSEFSDRDEGYYQVVKGNMKTTWTDQATAANGYVSDFDRFQRFLKALNQNIGKKIILWQIPIGNTLTKTCNNTNAHYKDNRAQYFLQPVLENGNSDKISQYGQAGVIAFLFGRGASSCTSFMDSNGDGVTGANETADDDGGYLRKGIGAYYQRGAISLNSLQ